MISFLNTIVAFLIVEAIIDKSFHIRWFYFLIILTKIVTMIIVINFSQFKSGQIPVAQLSRCFNVRNI